MTQNWLTYHKLLEDKRHNIAVEEESARSNRAKESIDLQNANTNAINATTRQQELAETMRSNLIREAETNRHNVQLESIDLAQLTENQRHNQAVELQTEKRDNADILLRSQTLAEQTRANKAQEKENVRSNKAREKETKRSNKAKESQSKSELAEKKRSNKATERLEQSKQTEQARHNHNSEQIDIYRAKETERSNKSKEKEAKRSNKAREKETTRTNKANESIDRSKVKEQKRSNKANEKTARKNANTNRYKAKTDRTNVEGNLRIKTYQANEEARHNQASEQETQRHNERSENIDFLSGTLPTNQRNKEYVDTGKAKVKSETSLNKARTKETKVKTVDKIGSITSNLLKTGLKLANLLR